MLSVKETRRIEENRHPATVLLRTLTLPQRERSANTHTDLSSNRRAHAFELFRSSYVRKGGLRTMHPATPSTPSL